MNPYEDNRAFERRLMQDAIDDLSVFFKAQVVLASVADDMTRATDLMVGTQRIACRFRREEKAGFFEKDFTIRCGNSGFDTEIHKILKDCPDYFLYGISKMIGKFESLYSWKLLNYKLIIEWLQSPAGKWGEEIINYDGVTSFITVSYSDLPPGCILTQRDGVPFSAQSLISETNDLRAKVRSDYKVLLLAMSKEDALLTAAQIVSCYAYNTGYCLDSLREALSRQQDFVTRIRVAVATGLQNSAPLGVPRWIIIPESSFIKGKDRVVRQGTYTA